MRIHWAGGQNMFRPQVQNPMQSTMGQVQDSGLQKVIQQINANCNRKRSHDVVALSTEARERLNSIKTKETDETKKSEEPSHYQKHPAELTQAECAERSILTQRDGIQTVSDIVAYAKSRLKLTMSKIEELENYLNGTGTHSDPNMTKELAEEYLDHYKKSIQSDYTYDIKRHLGIHKLWANEYDALSGGLASQITENHLYSLSAQSLGLSNLSSDPQEIMEALENASNILYEMKQQIEDTYVQMTGGQVARPAHSTSLFDGGSSLDYFVYEMEKPDIVRDTEYVAIDTEQMQFNGQTLRFR